MLSRKSTLEGIAENLPCFSGQPNFSFSATVHPPKCMVEFEVLVASTPSDEEINRYSSLGLVHNADEWIEKIVIDLYHIVDFGPDQIELDDKKIDATRIMTDYERDMVLVIKYNEFTRIYKELTGINIHKIKQDA